MSKDTCPNILENPEPISLEEEKCLRLDMSFFQERLIFPLDSLLPYERYLIFLKYKAEKSIVEMAHILQKNRDTVSNQLKRIHDKLRSLANEKPEDPR